MFWLLESTPFWVWWLTRTVSWSSLLWLLTFGRIGLVMSLRSNAVKQLTITALWLSGDPVRTVIPLQVFSASYRADPQQVLEPIRSSGTVYRGSDIQCCICLERFAHHDRVCRLQCRHAVHESCCSTISMHGARSSGTSERQRTSEQCICPACRGVGVVISMWTMLMPMLSHSVTHLGKLCQTCFGQARTPWNL